MSLNYNSNNLFYGDINQLYYGRIYTEEEFVKKFIPEDIQEEIQDEIDEGADMNDFKKYIPESLTVIRIFGNYKVYRNNKLIQDETIDLLNDKCILVGFKMLEIDNTFDLYNYKKNNYDPETINDDSDSDESESNSDDSDCNDSDCNDSDSSEISNIKSCGDITPCCLIKTLTVKHRKEIEKTLHKCHFYSIKLYECY
jgi:hypothetical protein